MTDTKPTEDRNEKEKEEGYERTWYQVLLFVGGIVLFGLVLGLILHLYIDPQNSTEKKDLVQALALIMAGVAGAIGVYFTWRGQRQTQEEQELEAVRVKLEDPCVLAHIPQVVCTSPSIYGMG